MRQEDGPRDELEPGEIVEAEIGRLVRHPRAETARIPLVLILVCITLLVYFNA
jgi:hypothetical protein